jgi:hypothetical protein
VLHADNVTRRVLRALIAEIPRL